MNEGIRMNQNFHLMTVHGMPRTMTGLFFEYSEYSSCNSSKHYMYVNPVGKRSVIQDFLHFGENGG